MENNPITVGSVINYRYVIDDKIGEGGMGSVYVAYDRLQQETVALKLALQMDDIAEGERELHRTNLANEFRVLASIRHPGIIEVRDFGFHTATQPYFTMELLEDSQDITSSELTLSDREKVEVLIDTLDALEYLHRRDILHCDLKPTNILCFKEPVDHRVKVLDFGLSTLLSNHQEPQGGTLLYMPPEAFDEDADLAPTYDLWAIGIIAYQMFSNGFHPFAKTNDFIENIQSIQSEILDLSDLDVNPRVELAIERLLERHVASRYQVAQDAVRELAPVINYTPSDETHEVHLMWPPFTGRVAELQQLTDALEDAETGQGSFYLVKGIAGIGKSRVQEELRITALVRGFQVSFGFVDDSEKRPYQMWHETINRIALMVDLTDDELSVLSTISPEIGDLLGRSAGAASPMAKPEEARGRLFDVVATVIKRVPVPLLILFRDLQWADSSSLALLDHLQSFIPEQKVMVVANYRMEHDEEVDPSWREPFEDVPTILLPKLKNIEIEYLADKMIGDSVKIKAVRDLIQKISEGIPLFLIETIRALADHAGGYDRIATTSFSDDIFPQGIRQVIQTRLNYLRTIDPKIVEALELFAVIGRLVEHKLANVMGGLVPVKDHLDLLVDHAIIEVIGDKWRFTHSRMQQELVTGIDEATLRNYHLKAAEGMIAYTEHASIQEYLAKIATHYEQAGALDLAGDWYLQAAEDSKAAYATTDAITYYDKALKFIPKEDLAPNRRIEIYHDLGKLHLWQTRPAQASDFFQRMRDLAESEQDQLNVLRALLGFCGVARDAGDRVDTVRIADEAIKTAQEIGDEANAGLTEALGFKAWALRLLGQLDDAEATAKRAYDLAIETNLIQQASRAQGILGIVYAFKGDGDAAESAMLQSIKHAEEIIDLRSLANAQINLGEVYRLFKKLSEAEETLLEALDLVQKIHAYDAEWITRINLATILNDTERYTETIEMVMPVILALPGNDYKFRGALEAYKQLIRAYTNLLQYSDVIENVPTWMMVAERKNSANYLGLAWKAAGESSWQLGLSLPYLGEEYSPAQCYTVSSSILAKNRHELIDVLRLWQSYESDEGRDENVSEISDYLHFLESDPDVPLPDSLVELGRSWYGQALHHWEQESVSSYFGENYSPSKCFNIAASILVTHPEELVGVLSDWTRYEYEIDRVDIAVEIRDRAILLMDDNPDAIAVLKQEVPDN